MNKMTVLLNVIHAHIKSPGSMSHLSPVSSGTVFPVSSPDFNGRLSVFDARRGSRGCHGGGAAAGRPPCTHPPQILLFQVQSHPSTKASRAASKPVSKSSSGIHSKQGSKVTAGRGLKVNAFISPLQLRCETGNYPAALVVGWSRARARATEGEGEGQGGGRGQTTIRKTDTNSERQACGCFFKPNNRRLRILSTVRP